MPPKRALITGIAGQDGSYLAELLLDRGYKVFGIDQEGTLREPVRLWRIKHLIDSIELYSASVEDYSRIANVIREIKPDECYHLAAKSYVDYSFDDVFSIMNTNFHGTHSVLSAILDNAPECRFYFAGSSEMFGNAPYSPQTEETPFNPRSPYGISKVASFYLARNFRDNHGIFACSGISYNHESERRGYEFATRKITFTVAKIKTGTENELRLGNLDARRDWGYSPDYVEAMWLMLQQEKPDDYILATGETHSVREFVERAFSCVGLNWEDYVVVDERFYRPAEAHELRGDASKARERLGWSPRVTFDDLVVRMVQHDMELASADAELPLSDSS